jgi:hypothetical protein
MHIWYFVLLGAGWGYPTRTVCFCSYLTIQCLGGSNCQVQLLSLRLISPCGPLMNRTRGIFSIKEQFQGSNQRIKCQRISLIFVITFFLYFLPTLFFFLISVFLLFIIFTCSSFHGNKLIVILTHHYVGFFLLVFPTMNTKKSN